MNLFPDIVRIDTANLKDIPLILEFRAAMFREIGVSPDLFIDHLNETLLNLYQQESNADRMRHFIVYNAKEEPVAVMGALLKNDFPYFLFKPGFYGWIIDAYTVPEYRGRGLATKLLDLNCQWLRDKGVNEIKLIASGKEGRRIYEKYGFKATAEMSLNLATTKTFNEIIDRKVNSQ